MDLTKLRHILAVARTGSFSRAAQEERITQPALSRSVAAFEQQYGLVLFDRGRGGVRATPAGTLVIEHANALLAASADLERSLRLYGSGEGGRVSFGMGPLLASLLLPELGEALLRNRPGLQMTALVRPPEHLMPELLNDRIEMIVGNNWQITNVPGTEARHLATLPLVMAVRAGHPLAGRRNLKAADLADYPSASAVELTGRFGSGGAFVCDNYHILRDTVLRTDCIWLTCAAFVAHEFANNLLTPLSITDLAPIDTDIWLIVRKGRTQSPAALAMTDQIIAMLAAPS
ncbi:LysR family transcriptional regulator [Novosphingobium sp.]|uniref:LysR family transcriptional regulator n=1 Tax=Novosphingobium sp. TaxID=1874826 RepID=UPI002FE40271